MASSDFADNGNHYQHDPFVSPTPATTSHRFSNFDPDFFALAPNASPAQARKALQAHLSDTNRRMEEAGKLGTALVQQQRQLEERLKDLESLQGEDDISPDLREKLSEIEKEYNEVARESARAFIPKQRVPSNEAAAGTPFAPEGRGGRRSVSPSKYEAQATGSPTKLSVPNRKIRNQPANRIHDIEFATEISTSLLAQVRNLQALLAEKEEELRDLKADKSKLEYEAEGFQQRVKSLDESENRYRDENWSLETQVQQLIAGQREASDREKKLTQTLAILQAEKNTTQRELDESKLNLAKLSEEHAAVVKQHDIELGTAKRTLVLADSDKATLRKKIDDLTGQNTELAKAFSSQRGRGIEREPLPGMSEDEFDTANDNMTPEHSPPASPVKGQTPRHSMLETETLKTSLGHAQRTIQSLRTNYHREKTEKMELRRMLQDARDELEKSRQDPAPVGKRARKMESREFKKPPRLLGGVRSIRSEIFAGEDPEWEDQPREAHSPTMLSSSFSSTQTPRLDPPTEHESSDNFETANEASDAFETANERGAETDFHTGAEEFSSDEDAQTETESPSKRTKAALRSRPSNLTRSDSLLSSASTEDDEYPFENDTRSPNNLPPFQARFPLRVSRGANRRSRYASEEPNVMSSPISFANSSAAGTPQQSVQNLAAELGDFDVSDNDSTLSATPSRRSMRARTASPPPAVPPLPRLPMVDSATMTESLVDGHWDERPISMATIASGVSMDSDAGTHDFQDKLDRFPSPPNTARDLGISSVHSVSVESLPAPDTHAAELAELREEHKNQIMSLEGEHATAMATALAALRAEHATGMERLAHENNKSQGAAMEQLKSVHTAEVAEAEARLRQEHAREREALTSEHGRQTEIAAAAAAALLAKELASLRSAHSEELKSKITELETAHSSSLDVLHASHAERLAQAGNESQSKYASELSSLRDTHAKELEQREADLRGKFDTELQALRAQHDDEKSYAKTESEAAKLAALAALGATHEKHIEEMKRTMAEGTAKELDALKSAHQLELKQINDKSAAALTQQLENTQQSHAKEIEKLKITLGSTHAEQLDVLKVSHVGDLDSLKATLAASHAQETEALSASHAKMIEETKENLAAAHARQSQTLVDTHTREMEALKTSHEQAIAAIKAAHSKELEDATIVHNKNIEESHRKQDEVRTAALAALAASHVKELGASKSDGEATLAKEIAAIKDRHNQTIESLKTQHAAAQAEELSSFKAALAKQVESSKAEGDAAHTEQLEAMNAANARIIEAHKRESEQAQSQALEQLKISHEKLMDELRQSHASQMSAEATRLAAVHAKELDAAAMESSAGKSKLAEDLKQEHAATLAKELETLAVKHAQELEELRSSTESSHIQAAAVLASSHAKALEDLRLDTDQAKAKELEELSASHTSELSRLNAEHESSKTKLREELAASHARALEDIHSEHEQRKAKELENLAAFHTSELSRLKAEHELSKTQYGDDLAASHAQSLEKAQSDADTSKAVALAALAAAHTKALDDLRSGNDTSHAEQLATLRREHEQSLARELEALQTKLEETHAAAIAALKAESDAVRTKDLEAASAKQSDAHLVELQNLKDQSASSQTQALQTLKVEHDVATARTLKELEDRHSSSISTLQAEHQTAMAAALTKLRDNHAAEMEKAGDLSTARNTDAITALQISHAQQLEDLAARNNSALGAQLKTLKADHAAALALLGQQHSAEIERLLAAHATELAALKQSMTVAPRPLSFSPLNTVETEPIENLRSPKREAFIIPRESTTNGHTRQQSLQDPASPRSMVSEADSTATVRIRRSQESLQSVSRRQRIIDPTVTPQDVTALRRPGSAASHRSSIQDAPPLPANHREAIEAARTQSSSGGKGSMGPPLIPASAYRPSSSSRPRTSGSTRPMSPQSINGTRNNRPVGHADMHMSTRMSARSRQSSVSSFASEIDHRFNAREGMGIETTGFGPNTDPRMIQAITQTMIGEYLWKYTRKTGRGEMSGNRHRRYFWVHPYTRTLYWGDRDPSAAGRAELKAKSVPIEAVRVVTDDNPMPPGLHRKSLIVISTGRTVKFTCTTGQRHETWFNALSYLLLRTGTENQTDTEDVAAGAITQEDIDEFNPSMASRPTNSTRPQAPPSLSSYNSRTTRGTDSLQMDMSMSIPTLTPTHERGTVRPGTLSRLSGYFKSNSGSIATFGSRRGRSHVMPDNAIYEASEVHDSAEDLRQIIEQQDREADRLENVRACCDGKHDVGSLSHTPARRGRLSNLHSHPSFQSGRELNTATPVGTVRSRA